MGEINEPLAAQHGVTFELCVGINTGEVLAGHVGDSYTVIGDTVNVAARLQAAARPGSVTVGELTYRATREAIEYRALSEPLVLKGKAEPVRAWEAVAADEQAAAPLRRVAVRAPLVGRVGELAAAARAARARAAQARAASGDGDRRSGRRQVAAAAAVRAGARRP